MVSGDFVHASLITRLCSRHALGQSRPFADGALESTAEKVAYGTSGGRSSGEPPSVLGERSHSEATARFPPVLLRRFISPTLPPLGIEPRGLFQSVGKGSCGEGVSQHILTKARSERVASNGLAQKPLGGSSDRARARRRKPNGAGAQPGCIRDPPSRAHLRSSRRESPVERTADQFSEGFILASSFPRYGVIQWGREIRKAEG